MGYAQRAVAQADSGGRQGDAQGSAAVSWAECKKEGQHPAPRRLRRLLPIGSCSAEGGPLIAGLCLPLAVPQQQTDRQASATRQPTEAHAPGMHLHVRASQQSSPLNSATIAPALGTPFPPRRGIYSLELEQRAQQHRDCLRVQKRRAACATLPGKLTTTRSVPAEKPAVTIGKRKIA